MKKKILVAISAAFAFGMMFFIFTSLTLKPRTGYILINDVYEKFDMKMELEKKYKYSHDQRQKILDSLGIQLRLLANRIENDKGKNGADVEMYNFKREEYLQKKGKMEEDNTQLSSQYDAAILKQLNQYVKDYGSQNGYEYIFGNDSNGSLMYAEESNNITRQVIEFINLKYAGK